MFFRNRPAVNLQILLRFLVLGAIPLLLACQSSPRKSFENVQVGMDKSLVVESLGSPTVSDRSHGRDRWIYKFRDGRDETLVREIQFEEGRAVYVGARLLPKLSAEEQDRLNEISLANDLRQWRADSERRDVSIGASRPNRGYEHVSHDETDVKLRAAIYGVEPTAQERNAIESRKRAPRFEPIQ